MQCIRSVQHLIFLILACFSEALMHKIAFVSMTKFGQQHCLADYFLGLYSVPSMLADIFGLFLNVIVVG